MHTFSAIPAVTAKPRSTTNGAEELTAKLVLVYGWEQPGSRSEHELIGQLVSSEFLKKLDHPLVIPGV